MTTAYQAILFDLDGVIVNSEPLHDRARWDVLAHYGIDVPPEADATFKGKTTEEVFAHIARMYADGRIGAEELIAQKQDRYRTMAAEALEPIPGALAFIKRLARLDVRLGLTTSATKVNQRLAFDRFGLDAYFGAVVTAEDITRGKPDPEPYRLAAERLGVAPARCLVIEDSVAGIQSAKGAGCTAAGLTTSFSAPELLEAGADVVVADFEELARYLTEAQRL